ncbi:TMV resistance protein N [Morus notabilis]|uniref:TMV resistance protein N n=1 Tax=Morus notabilis TaxID=981085 RepID=UPI000CED3F90|nr:TMV resistance protein N [Morus notabilis]
MTHQRHDVFLSFRGEDTRHGLAKELHSALQEAGIPTFRDDVNLERGTHVSSELLKAIQMSRVAIIVFSKNYASSSWCLDELVKILECQQVDGQFVLPVFFDVDPDDVGGQTGDFGKAFEDRFRSDTKVASKIDKWKAGLAEAAMLPDGFSLHDGAQWDNSMFIKEIISQISCRRQDAHMYLHLQPTMDSGKDYLNHLLSIAADDILIIGIYGIGNIGKTNLAKAVYNQNLYSFDGSSFLANVNKVSERPNGLLKLQEQLLFDLLDESIEIKDVSMGINMIKTRLRSKRVLVVLDDVEKLDQLNALARRREWFGSGSRIIITTRDANLLCTLESDDIYGPQGIQILKDKYGQNLEMIEGLEEFVRKMHYQAQRKVGSLMAELERERKKNALQGQIIAESRDLVLPSDERKKNALQEHMLF